ncbi:hypothetical protein V6N11_038875 [Hibiscus sabdariffa]|uniref:Uncharacterized protein n=1 Tax=Hibiscus sabdariffa TaxID=183260 RepID=A0ABR2SLJ9_9ROSI
MSNLNPRPTHGRTLIDAYGMGTLFHLSHLQKLDLSFNDFSNSRIFSNFGRFPSLTHFDLSSSWFSGLVPYEISYLSKLVSLHLSYSSISYLVPGRTLKLESSTLKGIVRNLTKPRWLPFEGSFPDNIFNLPNIQSLTLTANPNLSGQFPKSNWTSPLEVLDASMTPLSGELPGSLGNLKSLWGLALIGCNLSGSIPASLGNLSQLGFLFLSGNHFSGEIPSSVFSYKPHRTDNSCPCF